MSALPLVPFATVVGAAMAITHLVAARRTSWGPTAVVDRRTFRDAQERLTQLLAAGDDAAALELREALRTVDEAIGGLDRWFPTEDA